MAIELRRGDARDIGDVVVVGQGLSGERFAPEDAPPPLNQIEPRGADRNEGVLDARMGFEPFPDRATAVTGEIVGDEVKIPVRIGVVKGLEQREIAAGVAGRSGLGQCLPIPDTQCPIDPDFVGAALIV